MSLHEKNKIKPTYNELKVDAEGKQLPEVIVKENKTILVPVRVALFEKVDWKKYCKDENCNMTSIKGLRYLIKIKKRRK